MNHKKIPSSSLLILLMLSSSRATASVSSALINKALDSQQKLDLDTTLPGAIEQIGKLTGVPIEADPAVWDLLPWGEQTTIKAHIENQTLGQALTAITQKLGLQWNLTDEAVALHPMPALRRLGRRSNVAELHTLAFLTTTPINLKSNRPTITQLLTAIDAQLQTLHNPVAIENRAADSLQNQQIGVPSNATLADALDDLSTQTPATWYPWEKTIVILSKREQIRSQLTKTITVRYNNVDVSQVVLELLQRAAVDFTIDPDTYNRVPPDHRKITLLLDNATIQQALETIGGYTNLTFEITDDGIHISTPPASTTNK